MMMMMMVSMKMNVVPLVGQWPGDVVASVFFGNYLSNDDVVVAIVEHDSCVVR